MKDFIKNFIILVLFILFSGCISIIFQKNPDFDFFAYHYYNGWAFWNDRISTDIMPTFERTYFNPLLDGLNYLVITNFSKYPLLFYFISGLKYGVFLFLSYLYLNLISGIKNINKIFVTILYILLIIFSPILIHNIGCDCNDIQVNNIILISFYIFIRNIFKEYSFKQQFLLFLSSLLIGVAIGLKYTAFIYILSFLACYILNYKKLEKPLKTLFLFFIGILLGFIITDGFWIYKIYKYFHNPVFPYLNNIFNSPYGVNNSVLVDDFEHIRPNNIISFVFAPLMNTLRGNVGFEPGYFDLKIPLVFCFILYYIFLKIKKLNLEIIEQAVNLNILDTCLVFIISSYYINLFVFGQYRYILALLPIICLFFIIIIYLYSYFAKEQPINNNIIFLIIILCVVKYFLNVAHLGFLEDFAYILLIYSLGIFIYICHLKNLNSTQKSYYTTALIIIVLVISTTNISGYSSGGNYWGNIPLVKVEDKKFDDNSVILCGSLTSCFIAPTQNSKAKYVAYGLQNEYYNIIKNKRRVKARIQYNSPYLISKTEEIFKNNENIYFIFAIQDTGKEKNIGKAIKKEKNLKNNRIEINDIFDYDKNKENNQIVQNKDLINLSILDIYEKSLQDYSGKKVDFSHDCDILYYKIANLTNFMNYYVICKIK